MPRNKPSSTLDRKDTSSHRKASSVSAHRAETIERSPAPHVARHITDDDIRLLAYQKWEAEGRPIGHDLFFWTEAERELLAQQRMEQEVAP
jgi:hypothetical protein